MAKKKLTYEELVEKVKKQDAIILSQKREIEANRESTIGNLKSYLTI